MEINIYWCDIQIPFENSGLTLKAYLSRKAWRGKTARDKLRRLIVNDFGNARKGTPRYDEAVQLMYNLSDIAYGMKPKFYTDKLRQQFKTHEGERWQNRRGYLKVRL